MDEISRLKALLTDSRNAEDRAKTKLARAQAEADEARKNREAIERTLGLMGVAEAVPESPSLRVRVSGSVVHRAPSVAQPALEFLNGNPGMVFDAPAIGKALALGNLNSLRSALLRLAHDGKIDRVGHGKYKAKDESAVISKLEFEGGKMHA